MRELLLQHGCVFVAIEQHHHIGSVQVLALELVWVTCSLLKGSAKPGELLTLVGLTPAGEAVTGQTVADNAS